MTRYLLAIFWLLWNYNAILFAFTPADNTNSNVILKLIRNQVLLGDSLFVFGREAKIHFDFFFLYFLYKMESASG